MSQPSGDGTEDTRPSNNAGGELQEDREFTSDADFQPSPDKKAKETELESLVLASMGSRLDDVIKRLVDDKIRDIIAKQALSETAENRQEHPLRHQGERLETPASPTGNHSNSPTEVAQLMAHLVRQNDTTAAQATQKQNSRKQEKTNKSLLRSLLDDMPQSWDQNYTVLIWLFTCKQAELLPEAISEAQSFPASLRTILQQPATRCSDYKDAIKLLHNLLGRMKDNTGHKFRSITAYFAVTFGLQAPRVFRGHTSRLALEGMLTSLNATAWLYDEICPNGSTEKPSLLEILEMFLGLVRSPSHNVRHYNLTSRPS
jgi:hypothetical protein